MHGAKSKSQIPQKSKPKYHKKPKRTTTVCALSWTASTSATATTSLSPLPMYSPTSTSSTTTFHLKCYPQAQRKAERQRMLRVPRLHITALFEIILEAGLHEESDVRRQVVLQA